MNIQAKYLTFTLVMIAFMLASCNDNPTDQLGAENAPNKSTSDDFTVQQLGDIGTILDSDIAGRTIRNLELTLVGDETFTGRITNLQLAEGPEPGTVLASGRIIGQVNGERYNERFDNIVLSVFDQFGEIVDRNTVCQILYLELGPIFLDVLGLIVEVPDPIVVEVRAERGPGQLLGNLLCGVLGILDPQL